MTKESLSYDNIIIGTSFPALYKAICNLESGKKVISICDRQSTYFDLKNYKCSSIEKLFIIEFFSKFNDQGLDLNQFFHPYDLEIIQKDQPWLYLTGHPSQRLNEIFRKFPKIRQSYSQTYSNEEFDKVVLDLPDLLLKHYKESKKKVVADYLLDGFHLPNEFSDLVQIFINEFENDSNFRTLIEMLEFYFFGNSFYPSTKIRISLTLYCLLFPLYKLDHGLEKMLKDYYLSKGGQIREGDVLDWQIKNNSVTLLIEHYDGLLKSNEINLFGDFKNDYGLILKSNITNWKSKRYYFHQDHPTQVLDILYHFPIGSGVPLAILHFEKSFSYVEFVYKEELGEKEDFYSHLFNQCQIEIFNSLSMSIPEFTKTEILPYSFQQAIDYQTKDPVCEKLNFNCRNLIYKTLSPSEKVDISSMVYWGNFRSRNIGLLSYLLELKES